MQPIAYIFALSSNGIPITYGHGAAGSSGKTLSGCLRKFFPCPESLPLNSRSLKILFLKLFSQLFLLFV